MRGGRVVRSIDLLVCSTSVGTQRHKAVLMKGKGQRAIGEVILLEFSTFSSIPHKDKAQNQFDTYSFHEEEVLFYRIELTFLFKLTSSADDEYHIS